MQNKNKQQIFNIHHNQFSPNSPLDKMDISALSEDKFDAVDWINENFKKFSEENKSSKAASGTKSINDSSDNLALEFINNYVSKLQLYVQQVNYAVEDSSQQLVASLPRIVKDVKTLHSDVKSLQGRMLEMRQEVAAVQEETGECMATLEKLNSQQTKLQTAKESLQESDGWGNLISGLEDSFERSDLKVRNKSRQHLISNYNMLISLLFSF